MRPSPRAIRQTHRAVAAIFAACLTAPLAGAQSVRGSVVDVGGIPIPGVVVQLLDSTSAVAGRALTDVNGRFLVIAQRAGTFRVKTLRIGFRPAVSDPIVLATGEEQAKQIQVSAILVALDTVKVGGRNLCRMSGDSAAAPYRVWEQVRGAVIAAQLSVSARAFMSTRTAYDRLMDRAAFRVLSEKSNTRSELVTQPWSAAPAERLHRGGYVVEFGDSVAYLAPGLDMLASDLFVEDHCFRLVSSGDTTLIGIAFDPTSERRSVAEIRGTVWVDRKSAELRTMEFRYSFVANRDLEDGAKGKIEFARLRGNAWAIVQWDIQMPIVAMRQLPSSSHVTELKTVITGVHDVGGRVSLVRAGADTLFARGAMTLAGAVLDSSSGRGIERATVKLAGTQLTATSDAAGRFSITGVLPGEYTAEVRTAALDSLDTMSQMAIVVDEKSPTARIRVPSAAQVTASLCGGRGAKTQAGLAGIVVGELSRPGGALPRAKVVAEWTDVATGNAMWAEGQSDAEGRFRVCGVPFYMSLTLRASSDSASAAPLAVAISGEVRVARVSMVLDRPAAAAGVFAGVVTDSAGKPVVGAEVALPELGISRPTDGRGAFRVTDIPAGTQHLMVRKLGWGAVDTKIPFEANQTVERKVVLAHVNALGEVRVTAQIRDRLMEEFAEDQKLGIARFITREQLAVHEASPLSSFFAEIPGTKVMPSGDHKAVIVSSRRCAAYTSNTCPPCPMAVYLDDFLMTRWGVVDINQFAAQDVEGIEIFADWKQAPGKYQGYRAGCGVVVVHTRRDFDPLPERPKKPAPRDTLALAPRAR